MSKSLFGLLFISLFTNYSSPNMNWYLNTKIRTKIISSFIIVAFIALYLGYHANSKLDLVMGMLTRTDKVTIPHIDQLYTISMSIRDININERSLVNPKVTDVATRKKFYDNIQKAFLVMDTVLKKKDSIFVDDTTKVRWTEIEKYLNDWTASHKEVMGLLKQKVNLISKGEKPTSKIIDELDLKAVNTSLLSRQKYLKCSASLKTLIGRSKKEMALKVINANEEFVAAKTSFLIWTAIGFIIAVGLGFFISYIIAKPIQKLVATADSITNGNLDERVELLERKDEVGKLTYALSAMLTSIRKAFQDIQQKEFESKRAADEADNARKVAEEQHRYLSESVDKILKEMKLFSNGDLTVSLKIHNDDEIGKLYAGFNESVKNIQNLLKEITSSVQATASASNEISASSEEMAAGTQEQSAQTSEIAKSVELMTKTVIETTKQLTQVSESSRIASENTKLGKVRIEETKLGMSKIIESADDTGKLISSLAKRSDQIGEIAQVIDDIADQTNLLALNAAI